MKYTQVQFTNATAEQNEILIAMLADIGFEGFEENENELKAFINQSAFDKDTLDMIAGSNNCSYLLTEIEQQNWNAAWESSFEPVIIDDFAAIRAGFHQPVKNVQYEIIITPKMSFGTGHHATTYLMMEQMSHLDFKDKAVLDFGTGTGVLAILAAKMGASSVLAIDNDEWSIDNAKENSSNNNVDNISIEMAETINTQAKYDIILANINLNVILQHMEAIAGICKPGARILLSGFLSADEPAIKASLLTNGLVFNEVKQKKDWICIKASRS
ncbi:50S ribosomal protein L11 methyltransferase [Ferruginibacter profundus]